jgi:hypothetical protein
VEQEEVNLKRVPLEALEVEEIKILAIMGV